MESPLRALWHLLAYLGWTFLLLPVQICAVGLNLPLAARIPILYHRGCLRIIGLSVRVRGRPALPGPTLFAANHASYLDISVLGALIPGSFIAKSEVARWPLFGLLAKLQRTVFVNRHLRREVGAQRDEMRRRLSRGDNLILFPEGTSDDGTRVLPFKSALFSAAGVAFGDGHLPVQPVSIAYTRLDGLPMGRALRPMYAWYGEMKMAPHLWRVLALGQATVEVTFHRPVTLSQFASRKALAEHCWRTVAAGVAASLAGRAVGEAVAPAAATAAPRAESPGQP